VRFELRLSHVRDVEEPIVMAGSERDEAISAKLDYSDCARNDGLPMSWPAQPPAFPRR
jgi:hypothetical protein